MIDVTVTNLTSKRIFRNRLERFARTAWRQASRSRSVDISIVVVGASRMRRLNKVYRRRQGITDILTFPLGSAKGDRSGEIVICVEEAQKRAREYRQTMTQALSFLIIHGLLHLAGFNHEGVAPATARRMLNLQKKLADHFNVH